MPALRLSEAELAALSGLPWLSVVMYVMGIRPHMDMETGVTGWRRRISWQSLGEACYVEPHQGRQDVGTPHRSRVRRAAQVLVEAGVVELRSEGKHLIFRCVLADTDSSAQNKPDTNPTRQTDTKAGRLKALSGAASRPKPDTEPDIGQRAKADTPPESGKEYGKTTSSLGESGDSPANTATPRTQQIRAVLEFLNERTGRAYRSHTPAGQLTANGRWVDQLLRKGYTPDQLRQVIARKARQWTDPQCADRMQGFLRPETLFRPSKFEQYLAECVSSQQQGGRQHG